MALRPPEGRAGFTLIEALIAALLTGMLAITVAGAYRATLYLHIDALSRWPADAAADAAAVVLAEQTRAGTCLLKPAAGAGGNFLLVRTGADCLGTPLEPAAPGFVAACLDGANRLVFWRGAGDPPAAETCPPAGDFHVLNPDGVTATGLFRRDPIDVSVARAELRFDAPAREGSPAYSVARVSTITVSAALRSP